MANSQSSQDLIDRLMSHNKIQPSRPFRYEPAILAHPVHTHFSNHITANLATNPTMPKFNGHRPVKVLHIFSLVNGISAFGPEHLVILEPCDHSSPETLSENLKLEHELRFVAVENYWQGLGNDPEVAAEKAQQHNTIHLHQEEREAETAQLSDE